MNANTYLKTTHNSNDPCTGEIYCKTTKMNTTNDYVVQQNQIYQCRHRYSINKHINKNADTMQAQWKNNSFTGIIYNNIPNTKQTQGTYYV